MGKIPAMFVEIYHKGVLFHKEEIETFEDMREVGRSFWEWAKLHQEVCERLLQSFVDRSFDFLPDECEIAMVFESKLNKIKIYDIDEPEESPIVATQGLILDDLEPLKAVRPHPCKNRRLKGAKIEQLETIAIIHPAGKYSNKSHWE